MINLEIKGTINNNDKEELATIHFWTESLFSSYGMIIDVHPFEQNTYDGKDKMNRFFCLNDFYINLDKIDYFRINKTTQDSNVKVSNIEKSDEYWDFKNVTSEILIKKGTPYLSLYMNSQRGLVDSLLLVFTHEGEYQRIKRILTEKLCAK